MDYRKIIFAALFSCAGVAHAGYAQLASPERFTGVPGDWKFAPAANDARFGKIVHQANGLKVPVPGSPVTMPAAYRFAANAPRFAAAAIFLSPHVRTAAAIASWLSLGNLVWDEIDRSWRERKPEDDNEGGKLWRQMVGNTTPGYTAWHTSKAAACSAAVAYRNSTQDTSSSAYNVYSFVSVSGNNCTGERYWYLNGKKNGPDTQMDSLESKDAPPTNSCLPPFVSTPAGCLSPAIKQPDFVDKLAGKPMPDDVPFKLPFPTPLPVDPPWINPDPGPDPQHKPKFVPTSDPVPNPNYRPDAAPSPDNQPWHQPGVRIVPSPRPDQPWRVDIIPTNRPQPGPEPLPDTDTVPPGSDKPKPAPEQQSLCEQHPDILACQVVKDSGDKAELEKEEADFDFTPEVGFNGSGACPAPISINASGMNLSFSWQPFCNSLGLAKPIILALAWISAAFIMLGRKED